MLKELKYQFKTRNQFKPHKQNQEPVQLEDLIKIFDFEIQNPNKLKNINSKINNSFFIAGLKQNIILPNQTQIRTKNVHKITQDCDWLGHFNRQGGHEIAIFDSENSFTSYLFNNNNFLQETYNIGELWKDCGNFDTHKYQSDTPLISQVKTVHIKDLLSQVYKP
jgi:hypothetical protein